MYKPSPPPLIDHEEGLEEIGGFVVLFHRRFCLEGSRVDRAEAMRQCFTDAELNRDYPNVLKVMQLKEYTAFDMVALAIL